MSQIIRYAPYPKRRLFIDKPASRAAAAAAAKQKQQASASASASTASASSSCAPSTSVLRGLQPLWTYRAQQLAAQPHCRRCGGPADFEFQILPQLLFMLQREDREDAGGGGQAKQQPQEQQVRSSSSSGGGSASAPAAAAAAASDSFSQRLASELDFGTIVVYSCHASCSLREQQQQQQQPSSSAGGVSFVPAVGYVEEFVYVQPAPPLR